MSDKKQSPGPLMLPKEVSEVLQRGINQVYAAMKAGQIPSVQIGTRYYGVRAAIEKMVNGETIA